MTAFDLSRASLAYGMRMAEQMGAGNIEYLEADILDLDRMDQMFDVVECTGVLHHMADPMAGWSALTAKLGARRRHEDRPLQRLGATHRCPSAAMDRPTGPDAKPVKYPPGAPAYSCPSRGPSTPERDRIFGFLFDQRHP